MFRFPYLDSAANGVAITHLIVPTVLPNFLSMSVNTQIVLLSVNKISLEMHHRLYMKRDAPSLILIFHFLGKTFISLNGQMSSNQFSNQIKKKGNRICKTGLGLNTASKSSRDCVFWCPVYNECKPLVFFFTCEPSHCNKTLSALQSVTAARGLECHVY